MKTLIAGDCSTGLPPASNRVRSTEWVTPPSTPGVVATPSPQETLWSMLLSSTLTVTVSPGKHPPCTKSHGRLNLTIDANGRSASAPPTASRERPGERHGAQHHDDPRPAPNPVRHSRHFSLLRQVDLSRRAQTPDLIRAFLRTPSRPARLQQERLDLRRLPAHDGPRDRGRRLDGRQVDAVLVDGDDGDRVRLAAMRLRDVDRASRPSDAGRRTDTRADWRRAACLRSRARWPGRCRWRSAPQ